jgi:hypothetical protein
VNQFSVSVAICIQHRPFYFCHPDAEKIQKVSIQLLPIPAGRQAGLRLNCIHCSTKQTFSINCSMEISFNTPALLFPAISLLLLAYTNRFLALANLVRKLHDEYKVEEKNKMKLRQIKSLRRRINLIRYMQGLGVFSFLCCVACMYCIYKAWSKPAEYIFAVSLLSLLASLLFSLVEIIQSTNAIELELSDMEDLERSNIFSDLIAGRNEKKEQ